MAPSSRHCHCHHIAAGSWYTVDQTERGVKLRYGAVSHRAPGLASGPADRQRGEVSVRLHLCLDKMTLLLRPAASDLKISVTLRASPEKVADLYAKFGGLAPRSNGGQPGRQSAVKIVFGRYTAVKAIRERGPLNSAIKDAITGS